MLSEVRVSLEKSDERSTTVIVGRNNSGKTALADIFRRLLSDRTRPLKLEDFSTASYEDFCSAYLAHWSGEGDEDVRLKLPEIELRINFRYDPETPSFGPLASFIIDLDPDCTLATVVVRFRLGDGNIRTLFEDAELPWPATEKQLSNFFSTLRPKVSRLYSSSVRAEDSTNPSNRRRLDWRDLESLLCLGFISAQRGLDDVTEKEGDVLAKVFEKLFTSARSSPASSGKKQIARQLELAVEEVEKKLDAEIQGKLADLVPTLEQFGYPGLGGPNVATETTLEVERLLSDNTKVLYRSYAGVPLPESYNGLGSRNLIYILFRLVGFYREFVARGLEPGVQIIFIEEPEAHLHPQMQEVFIKQLDGFAQLIAIQDGASATWPVQFVVSTHSSHVANQAPFTSLRYFLSRTHSIRETCRETIVKDLTGHAQAEAPGTIDFLHQYLTLTKCDLFFADKTILVEGAVERLLLPKMIERVEDGQLASQYLTILEVGGAYSLLFRPLMKFLELPTLIITDIDSVDSSGHKCRVSRGSRTSNATIKDWFVSDVAITDLLVKTEDNKVDGLTRIAYQVPESEGSSCGRTFEDAFILSNTTLFKLAGDDDELELAAYDLAPARKKAQFGLEFSIRQDGWHVPRYIAEGLTWLLATDGLQPALEPMDARQVADAVVVGS